MMKLPILWKGAALPGSTIDFRAATADNVATFDTSAGPPVTPRPVSQDLAAVGQQSHDWLRVYMTFTGLAVPSE